MIIEILNRIVIHSKNLRSYEGGHGVVVALANECLILLNDKHDLLASKDARIRELEEALRSIEIGADPLSEYQAHSWIDTAREIANKALTPPKN